MNNHILNLAKKTWDYLRLNDEVQPADCILVMGSHDTRVADRAAQLYTQHMAPLILFSGGLGNFTKGLWKETEADTFANIAVEHGVPTSAILIENNSSNTGENIEFSKRLLEERGIECSSFILVHKPYMERRAYATFMKLWPGKQLFVTSPQIAFEDYPNDQIPLEMLINIMLGDLQRMKLYSENGFQIPQEIPADVWTAYEELVAAGFNAHLIQER